MDNENLLALLDTLGERIGNYKMRIERLKETNEKADSDIKQLCDIITSLETENREKTTVIEQLERELIACRKNGCGNA